MAKLTLEKAQIIVSKTLEKGRELALGPLTVAVVDDGGNMKAFAREDGPGAALRPQIATGKAFGAVGMGLSSRVINDRVLERPHFGVWSALLMGAWSVPGGVLIKDGDEIIGAVGVSGDTSDNDEAAAVAGIEAAKLIAGV